LTNDERRLEHIVAFAEELAEHLQGLHEDDFLEDRLLQRGVERLLTLIGEAAKNLSLETRARIDQPWREIIRLRDKGIHGYESLSPTVLYRIAMMAVPPLRNAVADHVAKRRP